MCMYDPCNIHRNQVTSMVMRLEAGVCRSVCEGGCEEVLRVSGN